MLIIKKNIKNIITILIKMDENFKIITKKFID